MLAVGGMHVTCGTFALIHYFSLKGNISRLALRSLSRWSIGARIILDPMPERFGPQFGAASKTFDNACLNLRRKSFIGQAGALELVIQLTP